MPLLIIGLRVFGFRRFGALFLRVVPPGDPQSHWSAFQDESAVVQYSRRCATIVSIAARHGPVKADCLPRSVMLCWLLRWRGIDSNLHIGVRKGNAKMEAHAWVERKGVVLNDRPDVHERFAAVRPFGGPRVGLPCSCCSGTGRASGTHDVISHKSGEAEASASALSPPAG